MIDEIQDMISELERAKDDLDRVIMSLNSHEVGKIKDEGKGIERIKGKPITIIENPQQEDFGMYLSFFASRFSDQDLKLKTKDKEAIEKTFKRIFINFGIYKGKNLQEILLEDQAYLMWLLLKAGIEVANPEKLMAELGKEVKEP